jgi:hypothetical protein
VILSEVSGIHGGIWNIFPMEKKELLPYVEIRDLTSKN